MSASKRLLWLIAVLPLAAASAQEWTGLESLTFRPIGPGRPLPPRAVERADRDVDALAAEEPPPQFILARIGDALESIGAVEAEKGENSPDLVPMLRSLASIYEDTGDYADAIVALDRAQMILRRDEGLFSLSQAEVIEQIIEVEMAIEPTGESLDHEAELRDLVQRNPGDPRNVGIMTDMAARQMQIVRELLENGLPPEFNVSVNFVNSASPRRFQTPQTADALAGLMLRRARSSYATAQIEAMAKPDTQITQLLELEDSIVDTYYFELMNGELRRSNPFAGAQLRFGGLRALEAKVQNAYLYPGTPEAIARAEIELADWNLLFNSFGYAMVSYEKALAKFRSRGGDESQVAALFSPATPVPLPAFIPNTSVFGEEHNVRGTIDVEIEVNRYGGVRDVSVVDASGNASDAVQKRLRRFVYRSRFRPRFVDGDWQRSDRFVQRYEFGYTQS